MNKRRRKEVEKAFGLINEAKEILSSVREEEEEAHDNLPESFRYGERGEEMEQYIDMLDEADGYIDDAISVIDQI